MKTAEDILIEKDRPIISVNPDATVFEALKVMVDNGIGSVLVKEGEDYVGIYNEREFVHNTVHEKIDPNNEPVRNVMVADMICAPHDETVHQLQDILLGKCLRHVIITKNDQVIGIISAGDVTRADLVEHEAQLKSVSWEYYENWRWKKKR